MRISSISTALPSQYNYRSKVKKTNAQMAQLQQTQQPSFKGWKAGLGGIIGTVAGGAIGTIISGGALLPVLLLGAAGTTGGCIYGSTKEDNKSYDEFDYNPCYPNCIDY